MATMMLSTMALLIVGVIAGWFRDARVEAGSSRGAGLRVIGGVELSP
jgi:uncharacterized membrane protein YeaQ/YmgE (transglycosylase-associated protein family)